MSRELSPPDFVTARPLDEVGSTALAAAAYMRRHGHCKHMAFGDGGSVCWIGAIAQVGNIGYGDAIAVRAGFCNTEHAVQWNNAPTTTAEMVIAALEAAAWSAP